MNAETPGKSDWVRAAVERHGGPLTRYAAQLTGNLDTARDVVQDTFLRLCQAYPDRVQGHLAEAVQMWVSHRNSIQRRRFSLDTMLVLKRLC